jgi:tetratricopeptide (TPR) repeat protein
MLFLVLFSVVLSPGCQAQNKTEKQPVKNESQTANQLQCDRYKPVTWQSLWSARRNNDHRCVIELTDILLSENPDDNQKGGLYYLKADSLRQLEKYEESIVLFNLFSQIPNCGSIEIMSEKGPIKVEPLCEVGKKLAEVHDNSSFPESPAQYTELAWKYFNKKRYDMAMFLSQRCIVIFKCTAQEQQRIFKEQDLRQTIVYQPTPSENRGLIERFWAVNDVGTCCYILGYSLEILADERKSDRSSRCQYFQAIHCFSVIEEKYAGAYCFDSKGPWYWQVSKTAKKRKGTIELKLGDMRQYRNECEAQIRSDPFYDLACTSSAGNPQ